MSFLINTIRANENINGLVGQYFPKRMDFINIQKHEIVNVQNILNKRPRKRFGNKSPNDVFPQLLENSLLLHLLLESTISIKN